MNYQPTLPFLRRMHDQYQPDNDFVAWNAYGNRYWPSLHLIDRAGQIRYMRIGEGNYERTETAIRTLLAKPSSPGDPPA